MGFTVALAGDTMLGRGVAQRLGRTPPKALVSPGVVEITRAADVFVLNLECCISERGEPWPAPGKRFFFRAPPAAVEALAHLGVDCVTLANNHALDFGHQALLDTFGHLSSAGIEWVGAGADLARARAPVVLEAPPYRLAVVGVTDHPRDFAAGPTTPGVAYVGWQGRAGNWVAETIAACTGDAVLVTPHWGPNMVAEPLPYVRSAAAELVSAGASAVAGHSAHVFHGVAGPVLYDMGDFLDDYAVDPVLRNDLGLLFLLHWDAGGPSRLEAFPLALDYCHTRLADEEEAAWIAARFRSACLALGTDARQEGERLVVDIPPANPSGREKLE